MASHKCNTDLEGPTTKDVIVGNEIVDIERRKCSICKRVSQMKNTNRRKIPKL